MTRHRRQEGVEAAAGNVQHVAVPSTIRLPVLPSSVREMAMSTTPLHNYGGDEFKWVNKFEAPKFDLWGKIGVEKPKTPRRM